MSEEAINNDELESFVTSTLNAIAVGVERAKASEYRFQMPSKVTFEVAVRATKSKEGSGGLKIQVFSAEGKLGSENEEVSRITFEVGAVHESAFAPLPPQDSGYV